MQSLKTYLQNNIKRHIITSLIKNDSLSYSQIYGEIKQEVDNVLFNYHLQHLVTNKILAKDSSIYRLSPLGKKLTSNITHTGIYFPKFVCRYRMYLIDRRSGKVLFQNRHRNPWFGDTTALSSKLVWGEKANQRANLRIKEKTNLDTNMQCIGTIRKIVVNSNQDILDDSLYLVCYSEQFSGELTNLSKNQDQLEWISFDKARQLENKNSSGGECDIEILNRLESRDFSPFFFEEVINSETF